MVDTIAEAAYGLYADYVALKNHFAGNVAWDASKVERVNPGRLAERPDFKAFLACIDRIGRDRLYNRSLLVTMFLKSPSAWIGDVSSQENVEANLARSNRLRRLESLFFEDINKISEEAGDEDFVEYLTVGNPPPIVKSFLRNQYMHETGAILNEVVPFTAARTSDPFWEKKKLVYPRYLPFVKSYIDVEAVKEAVKSVLIHE